MDKEEYLNLYRTMVRIRKFEEQAVQSFAIGDIPGFVHLSIGQEASAAGATSVLRKTDYITSTHRGHGHMIGKGGDLKKMMAELFAKSDGYCHGKGGSMHISNIEIGMLGANGLVGAGLPIATGAALASWIKGTDDVALCFFGDGASNEGLLHESLNFASLHNLPVVFFCENNRYAISTNTKRSMKLQDVAIRAAAYCIPGRVVDGNDVLEVRDAAAEAVDRARKGLGPSLIEAKTFKWRGHFEGDPADYRTQDELEEWKVKDPIPRYAAYLVNRKIASQEELDAIVESVRSEIKEAVDFALASEPLPADQALVDVYSDIQEEGR